MNVGTRVSVNGQLFRGFGTVEAFCPTNRVADILALPEKLQDKRRDGQPFPQMWVRADNGKLYHYNGDDLANGVVVPAPVRAQTPAQAVAPAGDDMTQSVEELHGTSWTVTTGGVTLCFTTTVEVVKGK